MRPYRYFSAGLIISDAIVVAPPTLADAVIAHLANHGIEVLTSVDGVRTGNADNPVVLLEFDEANRENVIKACQKFRIP